MFDIANEYLDEWEGVCYAKIYILADLFGKRTRVYIEKCLEHWYENEDSIP